VGDSREKGLVVGIGRSIESNKTWEKRVEKILLFNWLHSGTFLIYIFRGSGRCYSGKVKGKGLSSLLFTYFPESVTIEGGFKTTRSRRIHRDGSTHEEYFSKYRGGSHSLLNW
jgi:hypothetical protein